MKTVYFWFGRVNSDSLLHDMMMICVRSKGH